MPHYDYMCPECGGTSTEFIPIDEEMTLICNRCKTPMRKVVTVPGVIFKGNGWAGKE